ncbi:MAG: hypothetical protein IPO93_05495 [Actinobacteria bacterium]|nr:hypothetical protein [Actinomycetota bacterium]
MTGQMVAGTLLVLLTWGFALVAMTVLGLPLVMLAGRTIDLLALRVSMWAGLLVAVLLILATGILVPLRSGSAAVAVGLVLGVMLAVTLLARPRWRRPPRGAITRRSRPGLWAVALAAGLVTAYLAAAALGPVTNYDSGLYHLGAISYAGDYATIPGLANIYQAFGYNTSEFPFAAFLGNGPWDGQGFRMANGLIVTVMSADLVLRFAARRRSVGASVLLIGAVAVWVPLVALVDFLVTSPTSDSVVMVLSIVSLAYLADALRHTADFGRNASGAFATAFLAFTLRPTMAAFVAGVVAVLVLRGWRIRGLASVPLVRLPAVLGAVAVLVVVVQSVRDYLLSGWLQYPLSIWHFDVDWLAIDPVNSREATLGAARNPFDFENSIHGWSWVGPWLARVPLQWGIYQFAALAVFAIGVALLAHRRGVAPLFSRSLLLLMLPSLLAVAGWWLLSPPSFRFIWGPLFGLAVAPAGWWLHSIARLPRSTKATPIVPLAAVTALVVVVLVVAYGAVVKIDGAALTEQREFALGPVHVGYAMAPIPVSETIDQVMGSGLVLRLPTPTDQCWGAYPLCTPLIESDVSMRGPSIQDGFAP